ncbi:MAG: molecular chaperone DnaJ [Alphaproteobacteria bacterium]|nr:MAG: molecular chaperone DnaJ [Alphaproteobacteria bacterium]
MARDYYDILGVERGADDAALKSAYRKKAMQFHPDRNPGDKDAESKFKEINEAYDALKDPQKRAAYDRFGHDAFRNGGMGSGGGGGFGGGQGGFEGGGFEDLFEDLMGGLFGGGGQQQSRRSHVARGADLRYNLQVDLKDAYTGSKVDLKFPTTISCETCKGSGAKAGSKPTTCEGCRGSGTITFRQGFFQMSRTCPDCGGTGQTIKDKCKDCHGSGRVRHTKKLQVNIPAGVDDGTRLRLAGEGEAGTHGGPAGDLFVFVSMGTHPIFKRDGMHLHMEVPVNMIDAALGSQVELPTPDGGKTTLRIPAGSQPNDTVRLPGFGMPALGRPKDKGDLIAHLQVTVPTRLDKGQKALLEQLKTGLEMERAESSFLSRLKKFWGE